MLSHRQQVLGTGSAWNISILLAALVVIGAACEGPPPRSRPWRDNPLPIDEQLNLPEQAVDNEDPALGTSRSDRNRTLRIHMDADPGSLNPFKRPSIWSLRITRDTVFETLIRYLPSEGAGPGQYQSGLARSWTVSPGGREIRLSLHEAAKFQDGKAVTALDVQFSLESAMTKRGGAEHHRRALSDVAAVEIAGRRDVRIRLERPNAFVLRELASVPILPEHFYLKRLGQVDGDWIGSGPYKVASETPGRVVLKRDPKYWGSAPQIEAVHFIRIQDAAEALLEAKEGRMDIVPALIATHYPEQLEAPGLGQRFSVLELRPATFPYVVLDCTEAPFDDINVRRAIAHLVDRDALIAAEGGLTRAVSGAIWPGGPGDGASAGPLMHSEVEASRLLELAGWRDDDGDGVRARGGQRLMITVLATEGKHEIRDRVLSSLRTAGFVLDVRVGSAAVLRNRLRDGEFDLAFATWTGESDRDLSPLLATAGLRNYGSFQVAAVDALLEKIRSSWAPDNRAPLLGRLAEALRRSTPIVVLPAPHPRGLADKRVRGLRVWNGWFSIRDLSLKEES